MSSAPPDEEVFTLLVVDDNEANRDMLSRRLIRRGFSVTCAAGGHEALERITRERYDLILLDLLMPDMDGMEVLRTIRETRSPAELPVIITSAKDETSDVIAGLEAGANDYLTKPLDFAIVKARVRAQIKLKRAVERVHRLERDLAERNRALETANQRMQADLSAAARIQEAMLPASVPDRPQAKFAWMFKPCGDLAGDALNVFALDENHIAMYVLDVVGHGVAASLLSIAVSRVLTPERNSFLVRLTNEPPGYRLLPPGEVAGQLNRRFPFDSGTEQFFSLLYGMIDLRTLEWRFVCAGNPGPIHVGRGGAEPRVIAAHERLPIGIGDRTYPEHLMKLEPGDRLFIYTDGIPEAMSPSKEPFGTQRMLDSLASSHALSLEESLESLWNEVERWRATSAGQDDASVVAVEIRSP
jgi:sigma-B regulation protein RsbU (phosphoserine phosphatase)